VIDRVGYAFDTFDVREMAVDKAHWRSEVERWRLTYGDGVLNDMSQAPSTMVPPTDRMYQLVMDAGLTHDGHEGLARHVQNAVAVVKPAGVQIEKPKHAPREGSPVGRIDAAVDKLIHEKIQRSKSGAEKDQLLELLGKTAVANAKAAYLLYKKTYGSPSWDPLKKKGARPQRPLWASTSTKNPHYADLMYVDPLIGVNTVNTLPPATLNAFLDHGTVADTLENGVDKAREVLEQLKFHKIDLRKVTDALEVEGVKLFVDAYDKLLAGLRSKKESMLAVAKK
jgi:hypothetical protein